MAAFWVVDSSAWIFALRPQPVIIIQRRVDELVAANKAATTGMIVLELLGGARTTSELQELHLLLNGLRRIETRESDWVSAAEIAFRLRRLGRTIPLADILVACQARRAKAGVLHADRHFALLCREFRIEQQDFASRVGSPS